MAATNPLVLLALKLVLVALRLLLLELVLLALALMLDMLALVAQAMEARWLLLPLVVVSVLGQEPGLEQGQWRCHGVQVMVQLGVVEQAQVLLWVQVFVLGLVLALLVMAVVLILVLVMVSPVALVLMREASTSPPPFGAQCHCWHHSLKRFNLHVRSVLVVSATAPSSRILAPRCPTCWQRRCASVRRWAPLCCVNWNVHCRMLSGYVGCVLWRKGVGLMSSVAGLGTIPVAVFAAAGSHLAVLARCVG